MPSPVLIRPIRPTDKALMVEALGRLSPESRRKRFLVPKDRFSSSELRYLTEVDGVDHVALVALTDGAIVGVARFVRDREDPTTAEAAIVVADHLQGQGFGRRLGRALADEARARGIERFSATLLSDNAAAHRLFEAISERLSSHHEAGVEELVAELGLPAAA